MPYSRICHLVYLLGQILFILHHQIDQKMCRDNEQRFKVKRQDHIRPRFKKSPLSIYKSLFIALSAKEGFAKQRVYYLMWKGRLNTRGILKSHNRNIDILRRRPHLHNSYVPQVDNKNQLHYKRICIEHSNHHLIFINTVGVYTYQN